MAEGGDMADIYKPGGINQKRSRFLSGLPAEHQNLFTSGDRYMVQNASQHAGKGNRIFERIAFRPQKFNTILVPSYEGDEPITPFARSCIHAYALGSLYDPEWEQDSNPFLAETIGVIIFILATYTRYVDMVDAGLETSLNKCHIKVQRKIWRTLEEVETETKEARDSLAPTMGLDNFDGSPQVFTIVALSLLILIGKNVTDNNRDGWFRNRWRALAHVANVRIDVDKVVPPLLIPCQAVYSSASANHPIRSCIFRIMRSLASVSDDQNSVLFDRLIRLLQWAEMSHIWMIVEYIYDQNPDILNFPELSGPEVATMMVAIQFLKKYPKCRQ